MGVKSLYLLDQTDLFKIGNLVYGGKGILLNVYSSLQGQRCTVYDGYGKLVGLKVVSVKIFGLRSFFGKIGIVNFHSLFPWDILIVFVLLANTSCKSRLPIKTNQ